MEISGEIRQAAIFCENLVLRRRLTTQLGSNQIRIEDTVTNEGFEPASHMLLYHFNLGFPLLGEHTRLRVQSEKTVARDADAQIGLADWDRFQAPTPGYREQVFIHRPVADENGLTSVELLNSQMGFGLRWVYKTAELPFLMEWKMMGEGTYVVGVEPANCDGLGGRAATRAMGALPQLNPGETRSYNIQVEVISENK